LQQYSSLRASDGASDIFSPTKATREIEPVQGCVCLKQCAITNHYPSPSDVLQYKLAQCHLFVPVRKGSSNLNVCIIPSLVAGHIITILVFPVSVHVCRGRPNTRYCLASSYDSDTFINTGLTCATLYKSTICKSLRANTTAAQGYQIGRWILFF
jgi:hypothetical protein